MPQEIDDMEISDFYEFMFFEQMEPFGDRRMDLLVGQLCALIANVNRSKDSKPYKPDDFMIKWDRPVVKQTTKQQVDMFNLIRMIQNARVEQIEEQNG